ncbi:hypothetical protein [Lactococcus lactis]|uniref:hypothetical protein n=1 Tax=Lactococcus lactis TaxID=1358 RepID=UPI0015C3219A|nr:hypothetical protein [Lactococcus lactis]QLF89375.1 hypothetical protein HPC60_00995 [Lactococcus lactis subsp. lactis]
MQLYHKSEFSKVRITQIFYFRIQVIYKNEAGSIMKKFNHGDIEIETELEVSRDEFIHEILLTGIELENAIVI